MKRPAIFFDRDNTLIASDGYLGDPAQVRLIHGAADAIARARELGYATVVVSNQSGVARGLFNEGAVYAVNERMDALLHADNPHAVIDRHEFCPFHPEAVVERYRKDSDLRKPRPGMILAAAEKLALDLNRSWIVGDAPRDIEAGHAAGCRTVLFADPELPPSPAAKEAEAVRPDFVAGSLHEAIEFIAAHPSETADDEPAPPVAVAPAAPVAPPRHATDSGVATKAAPRAAGASATVSKAVTPVSSLPPLSAAERRSEPVPPTARLEGLLEQILLEMRRRNEQQVTEVSVSKLMAGIVQVLVLAVLFLGYLRGTDSTRVQTALMLGTTLQTMVVALLIMSRSR